MSNEMGYDANKEMIRGEINKVLNKHLKEGSNELMSGRTARTIAMQVEAAFPDRFGMSKQDLVAEIESVMDEKGITFSYIASIADSALDKMRQDQ